MPTQKMEIADHIKMMDSQKTSPNSNARSDRTIDVFISYKSEDTEYANEIYDYLKSQNFQVFFSKETLPQLGSDEYHEQIDTAIERTRHMVVVSSSSEIKDLPIALRNREVISFIPNEFDKLQKYIEQNQSPEEFQEVTEPAILASDQNYSRQVVALADFTVAKTEILENISWNDASQHAKTLSIGSLNGWKLPTLEHLATIRKSSLFPDNYCYWSAKEAGASEAFYMHFDDGHTGRGPKTFNSGLCAIFVQMKASA